MSRFLTRLPLALALAVLVALVFSPGLGGGFLFDDFPNIVSNPRVQPASADLAALREAATGYQPGAIGRPLATVGFALDYLASGKDPWAYKVHSLAVHVINALLVFWLLVRLLSLPAVAMPRARVVAAIAALAWATHPLQVSTVLYVVQRMEMLVTTFMLLALLAYLRGRLAQQAGRRGWPWLGLSALLAAMGLLAKESAVLFPLFTLSLELTVLRFASADARTGRWLKGLYAAGITIAAIAFFGWLVPRYATPESFSMRDFSMGERLLSQLRILPMYLGQALAPLPGTMTFYYDDFPKSTGLLSPWTTGAGALLIVALLATAWRYRHRAPLASLGVFWFFASHALTSNVLNLELAFEHRNYFALLGVVLLVSDLLRRIRGSDATLQRALAGVLVVSFALLATVRSAVWGDELLLAQDLVARNPSSARASSDLATLYVAISGSDPTSPFFHLAYQEFERGSRLPNASPLPEQGLILMAATTGQPVDPAWWDRLLFKLRTRPAGVQEALAVNGLVDQYYEGIALEPARLAEAWGTLVSRQPWPGYVHARYGDFMLVEMNDEAAALRAYYAAVDAPPRDPRLATLIVDELELIGRQELADAVRRHVANRGLAVDVDGKTATGEPAPR